MLSEVYLALSLAVYHCLCVVQDSGKGEQKHLKSQKPKVRQWPLDTDLTMQE